MLKILALSLLALLGLLLLTLVAAWLWLRAPDLPAATLEKQLIDAHDHFLELRPGLRLHYRDEGSREAPVLLLLHGYGDSYDSWSGWARVLKPQLRVISLDLPGHGLTGAPADLVLEGPAFTRIVIDFIERLGLPPLVLAGNSMGGGLAWQLAVQAPEKLRALVLVAAAGWPAEPAGASPSLAFRILQHPWGRALLARIDNRPLIRQGLRAQVFDKALISEALVERWALYQRYPGHRRILMSAAPASQPRADAAQLARLRLPTLVLHGEYDPLIPAAHSRGFAQAIPGARLILYPEVGHLPQREIAQRSAADVADFIAALR